MFSSEKVTTKMTVGKTQEKVTPRATLSLLFSEISKVMQVLSDDSDDLELKFLRSSSCLKCYNNLMNSF